MGGFLIDGAAWNNRRGYGRFTRGVVAALARVGHGRAFKILLPASEVPDPPLPDLEPVPVDVDVAPATAAAASGSRSLKDLWRFRAAARASGADGIFFPSVYTWFPSGLRSVTTVHDTIPESLPDLVFPNHRGRLLWGLKVKAAIATASAVVTVSESARRDVAARFGIAEHALTVVPEGFDRDVFHPQRDPLVRARWRARFGLPDDGILAITVGGLGPHKNLGAAIRACARLKADGTKVALALAGGGAGDVFHSEAGALATLAETSGLGRDASFLGYIPDSDLGDLVRSADVLLFPSRLEGFGLPALEALACGTPLVISPCPALRETAGALAIEVDPDDTPAFVRAILAASTSAHAARLAAEGPLRAARFTWDEAARRLLPLFDGCARK